MDFVRSREGAVIGIAIEDGHPDMAEGAAPTAMISVLAIPEGAQVGDLPDPIAQADELASANAKIAALEAQLAAGSGSEPSAPVADPQAARIAELEAELAAAQSSTTDAKASSPLTPPASTAPASNAPGDPPAPTPSSSSPAPGSAWDALVQQTGSAAPAAGDTGGVSNAP